MKFMIRSDIEGVTGVTTYSQAENSSFGQDMLMNDLNACIAGLFSSGPQEIIVYDEHTDGRNVDLSRLEHPVRVICGKPPYRADWGGLDATYDAMLMVGFHAKSGVPGALLPHSYSRKNLDIRLNGLSMGEIGMEAAIAGDFEVPLVMVTGDSAGMAEAEQLIPGIKTSTVKQAMGEFAAECLPPRETYELIRNAAAGLADNRAHWPKPFKIAGPVTLEIDLSESEFREKLRARSGRYFISDRTVRLTDVSATAAWSHYCQLNSEASKS